MPARFFILSDLHSARCDRTFSGSRCLDGRCQGSRCHDGLSQHGKGWRVARRLIGIMAAACWCALAQADVVRLRAGGEVRGVLIESGASPGGTTDRKPVSIRTRSGAEVQIAAEEVEFVSRRSSQMEDYVTRSRKIAPTIEGHLELAEWCRIQGLLPQREEQLEQVLDLDPDHPDARRILGYVNHHGRWMTQDDVMEERGYLRYRGRWVTRQELELIESNSVQRKAELAWMPKIKLWLGWITGGRADRRMNGLAEFRRVTDPDAVFALTHFLAGHPADDIRLLLVQVLTQIDGTRATGPLVDRILLDPSEVIRQAALKALLPTRVETALPLLLAALKHKANLVVCRSATALGELGDRRAVPALIDALVTTHTYQTQVPDYGVRMTTSNSGIFSGLVPPSVEIASRTGQLPYGFTVQGDAASQPVMRPVMVTEDFKNAPVLEALQRLTGQNLGFNERDWHFWWAVQKS